MKAYKEFDRDLNCRGYQYEEDKSYETDKAKLCERGFHACENPLDCLNYYEPSSSVYHEVELDGDIEWSSDDSKVAATKIKIGARLSVAGIAKGAIDFVFSKVKPTTGYVAHSATTGDRANASVEGKDSIAAVLGHDSKACGTVGCWLVLTERGDDGHILGVQAVKVDGETVKANTWYELRGGKVMEADETKKEDDNG